MTNGKKDNRSAKTGQYLTKFELAAYAGLSAATIQRLKDQRKIPFFQPAGKGGRILFPRNAIELGTIAVEGDQVRAGTAQQVNGGKRLSGPRPRWQASEQNKGET